MAELFDYTYVIDLTTFGPVYDEEFQKNTSRKITRFSIDKTID